MHTKYILSKKDNTNIEIKTVITDANLLITAYSDLMLIKKHITETVYLESQIRALKEHCEGLAEENKQLKTEIKHKNQLWKSAFRVYKKIKKKVENKLFPVEFLDVGRTIIPDMPDLKNNVVYKFSIPWQKVKEYILKKNKRGEK